MKVTRARRAPEEWMLSSYIATGMENVPISIKADNAEEEINKFLRGSLRPTVSGMADAIFSLSETTLSLPPQLY